MTLLVAVVIPTYKRPELLKRCLRALAQQSLPPDLYEVVVVDDGRDPLTRAAVESFNAEFKGAPLYRYLHPSGTRGPAGARNKGWRSTQAPLIAFTDDDTEPSSQWLHEGCMAMTREVAAVGGRLIVPVEGKPTDHERNTQGLEQAEFATANVFVWREALRKIGGFDERFTRAWREDSDLQFSLMKHCGPVRCAPQAVVVHPVRDVPWGFSLKQQANVFFDALLLKKHPTFYRRKIKPNPPWRYYFIVGSTLLAVLSALLDAGPWSLLWVTLAMGGIMSFCLQRLKGASRSPSHVVEMLVTSALIPFLALYWRVRGMLHFKVFFV